jgi:hypothetical protein
MLQRTATVFVPRYVVINFFCVYLMEERNEMKVLSFLNVGIRACRMHFEGNLFTQSSLDTLKGKLSVGSVMFSDFHALTREYFSPHHKDDCACNKIDFDRTLTNSKYLTYTGLTESQFNNLLSFVSLRQGEVWSARNALAVYLMKLRMGECVHFRFLFCSSQDNAEYHYAHWLLILECVYPPFSNRAQ